MTDIRKPYEDGAVNWDEDEGFKAAVAEAERKSWKGIAACFVAFLVFTLLFSLAGPAAVGYAMAPLATGCAAGGYAYRQGVIEDAKKAYIKAYGTAARNNSSKTTAH